MNGLNNGRSDSIRAARQAGLRYVNAFEPGFRRRRCGRGFMYFGRNGRRLSAQRTLTRIQSLAIPPAWEDVWISPWPRGHIQAVGKDAAGRRQYVYHADWEAVRTATKFERMRRFGELLPRIRRRVRADLNREELSHRRVLAAVTRLLDKGRIRVGNHEYTREHGSHGATTLEDDHVEVRGLTVSLEFPGKGGKLRVVELNDEKLAHTIRQCEEIAGQFLFCYQDHDGRPRNVDSTALNRYLDGIAGDERVTAKDFRTWWGTVMVLADLHPLDPAALDRRDKARHLRAAIESAAEALGNTAAVCRSSYVHPGVIAAFEAGKLRTLIARIEQQMAKRRRAELAVDEERLARLLPRLR